MLSQVVQVLLQNLGVLVAKLSPSDFKIYALPVLNSALDSNAPPILASCIAMLVESRFACFTTEYLNFLNS